MGVYDFGDNELVTTHAHVFEGEFDDFGVSDEPGINALSGSSDQIPAGYAALPVLTDVTFTATAFDLDGATANLMFWDGHDDPAFAPISGGTFLNISKAPAVLFSANLDGSDSDVSGFVIESTDASGFLHKHVDFALINAVAVPEGIYVWSFTFEVGDLTSEPVYFVHGFGLHDEEAHEAAVEHIEAALVPEPVSATLMLIGLGALCRR
ncbi:hypothetical protein [Mucisphaera calidilacus]|uniref:hypothetical protein n=1 Tax=Mucisphaera calidilacus TaxID=2527982 RepID=UPI00370413BF